MIFRGGPAHYTPWCESGQSHGKNNEAEGNGGGFYEDFFFFLNLHKKKIKCLQSVNLSTPFTFFLIIFFTFLN